MLFYLLNVHRYLQKVFRENNKKEVNPKAERHEQNPIDIVQKREEYLGSNLKSKRKNLESCSGMTGICFGD